MTSTTTEPKFLAIVAPHFTAGVIVGKSAAPVVSYMIRWDEAKIRKYCKSKKWECMDVEKEVAKELIHTP